MKIGLVTYYAPEIADIAQEVGFNSLELFVNPGTSLDLNHITKEQVHKLVDELQNRGLDICSITCSVNHLERDPQKRKQNQDYFLQAIRMSKLFGTRLLTTNPWADPQSSPEENLKIFADSFLQYAQAAEREGVLIALENCPHYTPYPYQVGSIGYSPEMWDAMFEAVPSRAVGLEFDPSHLFWLGIDIPKAIRDYGERIFAFHAKDCEIDRDALQRYGIIGRQFGTKNKWDMGWWRYRIPGLGQISWKEVVKALLDIGYQGPIVIEHEDPVFCGAPSELGLTLGNKTKQGLRYGLNYLRRFPV